MNQGLLPRRYALALYKFAAAHSDAAGVYRLMQSIAATFDRTPALQKTIANPYVGQAEKFALIKTAAGLDGSDAKPDEADTAVIDDFLKLLAQNKRLDLMHQTALAYERIYRAENQIYNVVITSAAPLQQSARSDIEQMVQKHIGDGKAEFEYNLDPGLIGGFTVTIDSQRLDASVKNEIEKLKRALLD